jgi:hypothetical protein
MRETDDIGAAIQAAAATVSAAAGRRGGGVVKPEKGRVRRGRRSGQVAATAVVGAVLIVALVLTLPGGEPAPVEQAADLALAQPAAPAPRPVAGTGRLDAAVDDVAFPDWEQSHGWPAVGQRSGKVDGRPATTVFYENDAGQRVGYTIVSGPALDRPDGDRHNVGGTDVTVWPYEDAEVAMWEVRGQTCIIAARDIPADDLARLAGWSSS